MWAKNRTPSLPVLLIVLLMHSLIYASPVQPPDHTPHGYHNLRRNEDVDKQSEIEFEKNNVPSTVPLLLNLQGDDSEDDDLIPAINGTNAYINNSENDDVTVISNINESNNDNKMVDESKSKQNSTKESGDDAQIINMGKGEEIHIKCKPNTEDENKSNSHKDESNKDDSDKDESDKDEGGEDVTTLQRTLKAGDIFTPYELLPVTKRLLKKVDLPSGTGRGIVSSAKSPEDLADRIFAAYFLTTKRIIILKDVDIAGLDTFQALALKGDPDDYKYIVRKGKKSPKIVIRKPDSAIKPHLPPKRSIYKLLTKKETKARKAEEKKISKQRRRQLLKQLQKKMPKNRLLIVNPSDGKNQKQHKPKSFRRAIMEPGCTWHYECRDPNNLQSCNLKARCANETLANGFMEGVITPPPEEGVKIPANFRRAVGVSTIDEEVEKIIERHILIISPENMKQKSNLESVDEYFNKLMEQHARSTTPMSPSMLNDDSKDDSSTENKQCSNSSCSKKVTLRKNQNSPEDEIKSYKSQMNEEKPDHVQFGVPLRKSNSLNSTLMPTNGGSARKSEIYTDNRSVDEAQDASATPRIVRLIRKG